MKKFWDNYVVLKVEQITKEELINQCLKENIPLRNIKQADEGFLLSVYSSDCRRVLNMLRQRRAKAKIVEKNGLIFSWIALMRRQGLIWGAAVCFAVIYVSLSYIWSFDISGNENYSQQDILAIVEEYGIQKGVSKNNLDFAEITKEILKDYNSELSWFWMQPKGTVLEIRLKERDSAFLDYDKRADLVATKDGVIEEILVLEGTARAQKGEQVHQGQIIIEGVEYDEWEKDEMGIYQPAGEGRGIRAQGRASGVVKYEALGFCCLNECYLQDSQSIAKGWRILKNGSEVFATTKIKGIGFEKILWQKEMQIGENLWQIQSWECSAKTLVKKSYDVTAAYQESVRRAEENLKKYGILAEDIINVENQLVQSADSWIIKVKCTADVKEDLLEVRYR